MIPTQTILTNQFVYFDVFGRDGSGVPNGNFSSLQGTIDDYGAAYITTYNGHFAVVPRGAAAVGKLLTVTFQGKDLAGNLLPTIQQTVQVSPEPVTLDSANAAVLPIVNASPALVDPGTATAKLI